MGRDRHYVPGDFYRVDDRTGFPERAKRTRKEWTGLIVHKDRWEYRHPQDFVKGVFDDQTVPEPRPLPTDIFLGPIQTTIAAQIFGELLLEDPGPVLLENASTPLFFEQGKLPAGSTRIPVTSTAGMAVGDTIEIMLDSGELFKTTIVSISGSIITIANPLPYSASSGNIVIDLGVTTTVPNNALTNDAGTLVLTDDAGANVLVSG